MASPKSIPSKVSTTATGHKSSKPRGKLYITAFLLAGDIVIDGVTVTAVGPLSLSSPIICDTFHTAVAEQVAYYEE
jgi:hypothetical protein